ncbi:MAG: toll/interleukin-1 receptor domain-containing protein [Bacteroidales bacterium]|nr:toll/interleukin-1 receptor domain-containing protein [Bacteroidales bacterium]
MNYDVFISYSRKDSTIANQIYDALEAEGVSCFIDKEGISGGADFPTVLSEAILGSKVFLLLASENSYASEFTQKEVTYAVSKKGSRFIFPFIIDNSQLPRDLEFLLSNINWRVLSSRYTIKKDLVADIKRKLTDPHAGETLKQRESNAVKTMMIIISLVVGLAVLGVGTALYMQYKQKKEEEQAAQTAQDARAQCQGWIRDAGKKIKEADALRDGGSFLESFNQEVDCLDGAELLLRKADSLKNEFIQGEYALQFSQISTTALHNQVSHKRDSMFVFWKRVAMSNYDDYRLLGDEDSRAIALKYVQRGLLLNPNDSSLKQAQEQLNKK